MLTKIKRIGIEIERVVMRISRIGESETSTARNQALDLPGHG